MLLAFEFWKSSKSLPDKGDLSKTHEPHHPSFASFPQRFRGFGTCRCQKCFRKGLRMGDVERFLELDKERVKMRDKCNVEMELHL
eukprot:4428527-Amphidinium_carterae.3